MGIDHLLHFDDFGDLLAASLRDVTLPRLQGVLQNTIPSIISLSYDVHASEAKSKAFMETLAERLNHEGSPAVLNFAHEIQALSKELWRTGYVACPGDCDMSLSWEDCQCRCTPQSLDGKTSYEVLDDAGVLSAESAAGAYPEEAVTMQRSPPKAPT